MPAVLEGRGFLSAMAKQQRDRIWELQGWFTLCITASSYSRTLVITKGVKDFPTRQPPPVEVTDINVKKKNKNKNHTGGTNNVFYCLFQKKKLLFGSLSAPLRHCTSLSVAKGAQCQEVSHTTH